MPDDVYTHGHHPAVLRSHAWRTVENSAPHLLTRLEPGLDVLDVGCGPGTITADLARRVAPGRVVGIDRSEEVVAAAAASAGPDGPEFRAGDVYHLDLDDDAFDVVHAHQVLQHLSDPVAALGEMGRVCRPDGIVAVRDADYGAFEWGPADERLDRWLALYRRVARSNDAEPDAGRHLGDWVRAAGLSVLVETDTPWEFRDPEDRRWWGGLWADRVLESDLAVQAVDAGFAARSDLEAMAQGFRDWANRDGAWFVVPNRAVIAGKVEPAG